MATTSRQTAIFGIEDWKQLYQTYREADFQSYDFESLRKSFVDYLRLYYPETFNDYIESSEFIALLDVIAFMGQALAFRNDLNTRENFLDTAERRDSVNKLANLVSYTAKRNTAAQGLLKVFSVVTTESVVDYNGINLSNVTVDWADSTNPDWQEQFTAIINAALVDTQKVGRPGNRSDILGVRTDEYAINLINGFLPVIPFSATVDGINMPFEAVTSTAQGKTSLYEPAPRADQPFNILFRNDQLGFSSNNTGYFFMFKQGSLQDQDFNLAERIANRTVNINVEGVNETDHWLFELDSQGIIAQEWSYRENIYSSSEQGTELRPVYTVNSRANDQITMVFGDGVFSEIPVGTFRAYVRASNGLQYIINPEEMQSVSVPISYISRTGNLETITFTCGITQPVSNSQARESIADIKQRAPARYYTQNRMVNGEDYNLFPYTKFNSIIKSKAVNRSSIGTSRFLDLVDNTGKYSSTNTFGSDGALWQQETLPTVLFTWNTRNEIADVISNQVQPQLATAASKQFYYANFPKELVIDLPLVWSQSTSTVNQTTGFFVNSTSMPVPVPVGNTVSSELVNFFVAPGALIKFVAPAGYYFDRNNKLALGVPTKTEEKTTIWAAPLRITDDGTNSGLGNFASGEGPVVLNNFVPTGALVEQVIPKFATDLPSALQQAMAEQIVLYRNFGIGYDNNGSVTGIPYSWYLIEQQDLSTDGTWSQAHAGDKTSAELDSSWLVQFVASAQSYTVTYRGLTYSFGSVLQTRFFFSGDQQVYDSRTGTVLRDFVNVLAVNTQPDSSQPLSADIPLTIIGQPVEADGFVDDFQVTVSYSDSDNDGIPDNPNVFVEIVNPLVAPTQKYVFFERTVDFDNLERYLLVEPGRVSSDYGTLADIQLAKNQWAPGQVFYAYTDGVFYQLSISTTGVRNIVSADGWIARTGRQGLYYQYRHNSPLTNRIDPGTTNIIDLYVVTQNYYTAYQNWIRDTTGTVPQPSLPTIDELGTEYQQLQEYKMISDNIILNPVKFKPLFGAKAPLDLRGTIKVIRAARSTASTSEIKSSVIAEMNNYFSVDKWNFGDVFYFSELSAYLHQRLGSIISSVVLVPLNQQKSFGDLYEVRSAPDELFVNAATVENIEVIDALTSTNLRTAPGSGVI